MTRLWDFTESAALTECELQCLRALPVYRAVLLRSWLTVDFVLQRGILRETLCTVKYYGSVWSATRDAELCGYPLAIRYVKHTFSVSFLSNDVLANDEFKLELDCV